MEPDGEGHLVALEGIDGAGKSTLASSLVKTLNDNGLPSVLVDKHTTSVPGSEDLSEYLDQVNAVIYRRKPSVGPACGDHYWLFALAAWYALLDRLLIRPALGRGEVVVMDNAYSKIVARYAASGEIPNELVEGVFGHLRPPDLVLFLDLPPAEALRRKGEFTSLEAGHSGTAASDFVDYQERVTNEFRSLMSSGPWEHIAVLDRTPDEVLALALAAVRDRLGLAVGPTQRAE